MMRWMVRSPAENFRLIATLRLVEHDPSARARGHDLRRRWHRNLDRWPLQHLLMELVELGIRLAPPAIGKAEVGIAEHADKADLRDGERAAQDIVARLEPRH